MLYRHRKTGCATQAYRETYDKAVSVIGKKRADAFEQALNTISTQTGKHPQVTAALSHWSTCATGATGIALSDPSDIEAIIQGDLNRSVSTAGGLPLEALLHAKYDSKTAID